MPSPGGPRGDVDTYIKPTLFPAASRAAYPASDGAVLATTQRPLAASTLSVPSGPPASKTTVPSWAVIGTADQVIPPAELVFLAQPARADITEVKAGHLSLISKPAAGTRVIETAASSSSSS